MPVCRDFSQLNSAGPETDENILTAFRSTRQTDIISTLVSIYDSKDIFVKELQILLGKRLLEIKDQNYDAEVHFLLSILLAKYTIDCYSSTDPQPGDFEITLRGCRPTSLRRHDERHYRLTTVRYSNPQPSLSSKGCRTRPKSVTHTYDHHIATLLASCSTQFAGDAWTVPKVRGTWHAFRWLNLMPRSAQNAGRLRQSLQRHQTG